MLKKSFVFAFAVLTAFVASHATAAAPLAEAFGQFSENSTVTVAHGVWDKLLKIYVKPDGTGLNRVDYAAFKANDRKTLRAYLKHLENTNVVELGRAEQFAFWANLYNAKTVDVVLEHYPVASIRQISLDDSLLDFLKKSVGFGGPWKAKILTVAGHKLSLDDIEHAIMRPVFKDPRVHYAINCASIGCPNLRTNALTGANLETELDAGAIDYVNSTRGFAIHGNRITASSIYSWFQDDFGASAQGVIAHALKYAKPQLKAKLAAIDSIDGFAYDWALNDIERQ